MCLADGFPQLADVDSEVQFICKALLPTSLLTYEELQEVAAKHAAYAHAQLQLDETVERALSLLSSAMDDDNMAKEHVRAQWQKSLASMFRMILAQRLEEVITMRAIKKVVELPTANPTHLLGPLGYTLPLPFETIVSTGCYVHENFIDDSELRAIHEEVARVEAAGKLHAPYLQRMKGIRFDTFAWLTADSETIGECPLLATQMRRLRQNCRMR
jgi:hypothetical protein